MITVGRAQKKYTCDYCNKVIPRGSTYWREGKYDRETGDRQVTKLHTKCEANRRIR